MFFLFLIFLVQGPPFYTNPVHPNEDLKQLQHTIEMGLPIDQDSWQKKIALYTETGELFSAEKIILLLSEQCPDHVVFREAEILILAHQKDWERVYTLGEDFLRKYPKHATIRVNLARIYSNNGLQAKALNLLLEQVEYHQLKRAGWVILFNIISTSNSKDQSWIEILEKKIDRYPDILSLKHIYLNLLVRTGAYDQVYIWLKMNPQLWKSAEMKLFFDTLEGFQ